MLGTLLVTATAAALLVWDFSDNFWTVIPGHIYRSGQNGAGALERRIAAYGIRSILNLRGANPDSDWYQDERAVADRCGVEFFDLSIDSWNPPDSEEMRALIDILDTCPKPALIHCEAGIDRTGYVAAICVLLDDAGSPVWAREHFGLHYGQLPFREKAIHQRAFLDLYQFWLTQLGYEHSSARFREWALQVYDPMR